MFDGFPWALAGFVGAALAPTDAALSVQVINDERIPLHLRRALNVESGLNDGIATPIVVFMLAVAASQLGVVSESVSFEAGAALRELGGGIVAGVVVGVGGAVLISTATRRRWIITGGRRLATLAVAIAAFAVALAFDANGFIAAFVAGIAFGAMLDGSVVDLEEAVELPELGGELLALVVWFLFGATLVPLAFEELDGCLDRLRAGQPDDHPHAPGRIEPRPFGTRPAQRRVHRLVRSARARVGGVRPVGHRRVGRDLTRSRAGRRHGGTDGAAECGAPRHHRPSRRPALRPERAEQARIRARSTESSPHPVGTRSASMRPVRQGDGDPAVAAVTRSVHRLAVIEFAASSQPPTPRNRRDIGRTFVARAPCRRRSWWLHSGRACSPCRSSRIGRQDRVDPWGRAERGLAALTTRRHPGDDAVNSTTWSRES